jgi:excisionase family DNA binding protein
MRISHESSASPPHRSAESPSTTTAYLKVAEAAELCRCSQDTIRRAISARRLTCVKPSGKFGRTLIRPRDLEAYMLRATRYAIGETNSTSELA